MSAPSRAWPSLETHRAWLEAEATRLLEFARGSRVQGGFGWLNDRGGVEAGHPLDLLITGRMTHVFALGHLMGHPGCGTFIDHGLEAIRDRFEDRQHGGWYAALSEEGALSTDKHAYSHAFVLLAAASATLAGRPGASKLLEDALEVVDTHFWSEADGAMVESWDREWREMEAYRGANGNMHMVEALLAAGDATGDTRHYGRAQRIAERIVNDVARDHDWRIVEHFDERWQALLEYNADQPRHPHRPFGITPGHGFEWSRLLLQVAASAPQPPGWLLEASRGLFARAMGDGWHHPGGFVYTTDHRGRPHVVERLHWVVCEAIAAAAPLHAATGEVGYERHYRALWDFAEERLIDRCHGSWHHELDDELRPSTRIWSGKNDVYHALHATIVPRISLGPSIAGALAEVPAGLR